MASPTRRLTTSSGALAQRTRFQRPRSRPTPPDTCGASPAGRTAAPPRKSLTVPASAVGVGIRMVATYTPVGALIVNSTLAGVSVMVNGSACATPCTVTQPVGAQIDIGAPGSVPQGTGSRQSLTGWTGGSSGGP